VRARRLGWSSALRIGAADAFARLEVGAPLRAEKLSPKAELTAVVRRCATELIDPSTCTLSRRDQRRSDPLDASASAQFATHALAPLTLREQERVVAPASSAVAAGCAERDVMPPSDAEIKSLGDAAPSK